jgi:hypothetical protein
MFADSALAAVDIIWGQHLGRTAFRDGQILILMSLDPFSDTGSGIAEEIEAKLNSLALRYQAAAFSDDAAEMAEVESELMALGDQANSIPRRLVFHPSLYGTELAWAVARVDFWFNDLQQLREEAEVANGGKTAPDGIFDVDVQGAQTWQFFERDSQISLTGGKGKIGSVSVLSNGSLNHYGISMFVFEEQAGLVGNGAELEGRRLEALEVEIQPMLDWLSENHPDFMRLNDFSEAFTIARWAHAADVTPLIMGLNGKPETLAMPDSTIIGRGPKVTTGAD